MDMDPVEEFSHPEWITHETKAARERAGAGEFVRKPGEKHECRTPTWATRGTVWRCDCGRRWIWREPGNPDYEGWYRRVWPWPR